MNDRNDFNYESPYQNHVDVDTGASMQPDGFYHYTAAVNVPQKKEKRQKGRRGRGAAALVMVLCILFSGVFAFGGTLLANRLIETGRAGTSSQGSGAGGNDTVTVPMVQHTNGLTTTELAAKVKPSVVEITTEAMAGNGFIQQLVESGAGSGVVWTQDGYIVTNYHVVEGASQVTVRLSDGTSYPATYVGGDKESDIAVIKIEATGLTAVTTGDSSALVVGQDIIAVGNPLGELGGTVTNGIISALDRDVTLDGQTMRLLQTNAAINPGNSGGGLFDANGNLIGIVNAKSSGNDIEGLGFAIPINTVKQVTADLIEKGYVSGRVNVGLTLLSISDPSTAMRYGVSEYGVYVYSAERGSSAETAGFQSGDRISAVNGKEVSSAADVKTVFTEAGVGTTVEVTVVRGGREYTLSLLLTEAVPNTVTGAGTFQTGDAA